MSEKPPGTPDLLDLSALLTPPPEPAAPEPVVPDSHLHLLPPETEPTPAPEAVVSEIAQFAAHTTVGNPQLTPRIPFTLRIMGTLAPHHRVRLLDLIKAADLGLRELDLEPQLESGQVLLTRISEYVGIQIVQALRDAPVRMTLTPEGEDPDLLPSAP